MVLIPPLVPRHPEVVFALLQLLFFTPQDAVSVDVSDDSWVRKPRCSDIYGLSIRVRGGEGVKVVVVGGIRKGVPEWGGY